MVVVVGMFVGLDYFGVVDFYLLYDFFVVCFY